MEKGFGRKDQVQINGGLGTSLNMDSDLKLKSDLCAMDKIWESLASVYR